ncbi:BRO-N domain-containing protein [Massilia oculi]|uniref:BRO-N domain-containing protein n=1 Tax=Massilia oculi TaxID=945844 RepID=UPI001E4FD400|nr:BRO family protein [Massilia oculi]
MTNHNPMAMDALAPLPNATPNPTPSLFQFNDNAIRTDVDHQGNPWFVAADVCAALGIKNSRDALATLDPDEKGVATTDTLGGTQSHATINEHGLYALVFRSRKREAKDFQRWVTHSVLPALRKDGLYVQGEERLLAGCLTEDEVSTTVETMQANISDLAMAKALRLKSEHQEEKDARYMALKMMNRGRVRRRSGPKQFSR